MLYFFAMVVPPLAVLFTGRKTAAVLNIPLTLAGWLPGVLHAVLVVNEHKADQRARRDYFAALDEDEPESVEDDADTVEDDDEVRLQRQGRFKVWIEIAADLGLASYLRRIVAIRCDPNDPIA